MKDIIFTIATILLIVSAVALQCGLDNEPLTMKTESAKSLLVLDTASTVQHVVVGTYEQCHKWNDAYRQNWPEATYETRFYLIGDYTQHVNSEKRVQVWKSSRRKEAMGTKKKKEHA